MRMQKILFVWVALCVILTGCWDIKDPQDVNYFTAIGFDYVDDQYIAYAQMIDFSTMAKSESGKPEQSIPVWTGRGIGETPTSAMVDLYNTAQLRVFYGHVNAIIYSDNILKSGVERVWDAHNRYYEMRYTPWVFGASRPIDELLEVTPFFFLSPAMSLLHQPMDNYKQQSTIKPITVREFISNFHEPGRTVILPALDINQKDWKEGGEASGMLTIDGIYMIEDKAFKGKLKKSEILGLRWMEPATARSQLVLRSSEQTIDAVLSLKNPRVQVTPAVNDGTVTYSLDVKLTGSISELLKPTSYSKLELEAEEKVRKQIRSTFDKGLALDSDPLQLENSLYRQNVKCWKELRNRDKLQLSKAQVNIEVDVKLTTSGKMKMVK